MQKSIGVVHFIAECKDCGWNTQSYKNGQALAAKHAKHYKHEALFEVGLSGFYDGSEL